MSTTADQNQRMIMIALPFVFVDLHHPLPGRPARLLDHDEPLDGRPAVHGPAHDRVRPATARRPPPGGSGGGLFGGLLNRSQPTGASGRTADRKAAGSRAAAVARLAAVAVPRVTGDRAAPGPRSRRRSAAWRRRRRRRRARRRSDRDGGADGRRARSRSSSGRCSSRWPRPWRSTREVDVDDRRRGESSRDAAGRGPRACSSAATARRSTRSSTWRSGSCYATDRRAAPRRHRRRGLPRASAARRSSARPTTPRTRRSRFERAGRARRDDRERARLVHEYLRDRDGRRDAQRGRRARSAPRRLARPVLARRALGAFHVEHRRPVTALRHVHRASLRRRRATFHVEHRPARRRGD